jgi:hypothetical protein
VRGSLTRRTVAPLMAAALLVAQTHGVAANNFGSDWDRTCDTTTAAQCIGWDINGVQEFGLHAVEANQAAATRYACTEIYAKVANLGCWEIIASDWGVDVYDGDYGTQWFAWTACAAGALTKGSAANHTKSCFPQVLKYDLSHPTAYDTLSERRKIACHEFGHSYGLRHSTTSGDGTSTCMTPVATQSTVIGISSHDKSHLNGYFQ